MMFFATAATGTEPALRDELREIGLRGVRADRGGVHFEGDAQAGWHACLESRIALRILGLVATFEAHNEKALYRGARDVRWETWMNTETTLAVTAASKLSQLHHTGYLAQLTKDAIVDRLRDQFSARPSVDRQDPDMHVFMYLARDQASVYVDFSGESLHRRGWRLETGEAPLRETLAAAVLRMSGWDRQTDFWDPMCGSGTLAIEADLWARRVAPGLSRDRFGFERWIDFGKDSARQMATMRAEAKARILEDGPAIYASDNDSAMVDATRANAQRAGAHVIASRGDVLHADLPAPSLWIVINPPYGERLGSDRQAEPKLIKALMGFGGQRVSVLSLEGWGQGVRIRPLQIKRLCNGPLKCQLITWQIPVR